MGAAVKSQARPGSLPTRTDTVCKRRSNHMVYRKILGAPRRRVQQSETMPSETPPPDSRPYRPTMPPGDAGVELEAFEQRIRERDEQTARLENLARVYGFAAVR